MVGTWLTAREDAEVVVAGVLVAVEVAAECVADGLATMAGTGGGVVPLHPTKANRAIVTMMSFFIAGCLSCLIAWSSGYLSEGL